MKKVILSLLLLSVFFSCRKNPPSSDPSDYNPDWTFTTHGESTPDYAIVFPQNSVNRIDIVLGANKWASIRSNMIAVFGSDFGSLAPGGGNVNGEPSYVDAELSFNGKKWKNVGFRLKGNSTLRSAWNSGNYKLPFRLDFDQFEDSYPGIKNQRFFGFKELSFSPGFKDPSLIREKLASDIFRLGGVPSSQTAFYRVFVDIGTGLKYWGLYCGVELPDDNMIAKQLGEKDGNLYKPESKLKLYIQGEFIKENNESANDFSDVQQLVATLNSNLRISNPSQWRTDLEKILNTHHFLQWLAVNNGMVNWDSYGIMSHNYYMYHHSTDKFIWIPWDNNEAMLTNPGIVGATGGNGMNGLSLSMNEVTANWPLIRYLADDPTYMQSYKDLLRTFKNNVLTNAVLDPMIDNFYDLITPFVIGPDGEQPGYGYITNSSNFINGRAGLKLHVSNRNTLIGSYVP